MTRTLLPLLLLLGLSGCVNQVIAPPPPADPVDIYLLDYGRTPALLLPRPQGDAAQYVYGDWQWYALNRTDLGTGLAALFWPTQGALGRRIVPEPLTRQNVVARYAAQVEQLDAITVDRQAAWRLSQQLDAIFAQHIEQRVVNEPYDLEFVPHPQDYTYTRNSNRAVADWLRELGCEVRGPTLHSNWKVVTQEPH